MVAVFDHRGAEHRMDSAKEVGTTVGSVRDLADSNR